VTLTLGFTGGINFSQADSNFSFFTGEIHFSTGQNIFSQIFQTIICPLRKRGKQNKETGRGVTTISNRENSVLTVIER